MIRAELAQFVSDLGKANREVERTAAAMRREMQQQSKEARNALSLLTHAIGISLPRELKRVIAETPAFRGALSAAFAVAPVVAFAGVIAEYIPAAIDKVKKAFFEVPEAVEKASKEAAEHFKKLNDAIKDTQESLNKFLEQGDPFRKTITPQLSLDALRGQRALLLASRAAFEQQAAQTQVFVRGVPGAGAKSEIIPTSDAIAAQEAIRQIDKQVAILDERIKKLGYDAAIALGEFKSDRDKEAARAAKEQADAFHKVVEGLKELPIKNERITDLLFPLRFDKDLLAAGEHAMKLVQPLEAVEVGLAKLVNPVKDAQKSIREMFQEYDRGVIHAVLGQGKVFEQIEKSREAVRKFGHDIGDSLKQLIVHGASARQVFQALLFDVASFLFNKYALPGFGKSGVGGFLGSLFGGIFGGGRQHGGTVEAGRAYVVGEAGPELFFPRMSGAIVPALAGGVTNVFNIDARGAADPSGIFRAAERLKREAAALAVAIVEERRRRR